MNSESSNADTSSSILDSKLPSDDNDDVDEDENELEDDIYCEEEWMNGNRNNNNHDKSARPCALSISTTAKLIKSSSSRPSTSSTTNNHSEIEKRRRDRMNHLIEELISLLPNYATDVATHKRKLDKISVLRLNLQYISAIKSNDEKEWNYNERATTFLPLPELFYLMEKCIESIFVVTDLGTGNILYASEGITKTTRSTSGNKKRIQRFETNELVRFITSR